LRYRRKSILIEIQERRKGSICEFNILLEKLKKWQEYSCEKIYLMEICFMESVNIGIKDYNS
jgi:hypothetical protein